MKHFFLTARVSLIFLLFFVTNTSHIGAGESVTKEEAELVRLTNCERERAHLPPYKIELTLMTVARYSSNYMAERNQSAHHRPDGKSAVDRVIESGYRTNRQYSREIILTFPQFTKHNDFSRALKSWMESADHKELILNTECEDIGVAMATSKQNITYFTEVFSRKVVPIGAQKPQVFPAKVTPSLASASTSAASAAASSSDDEDLPLPGLPDFPELLDLPEIPFPEFVYFQEVADRITDPGELLVHLSRAIFGLVTNERVKAKLCVLKVDFTLRDLAEKDACYMASHNRVIYHHGDKTSIDRVIESGYCAHRYSSELGAVIKNKDVEAVVQQWMNTHTYSQVILNGNYEETGVGLAYAADKRIYIAQLFSRKLPFYATK